MAIRTVINLCDEEEQTQLECETISDMQLDNGITISVGDIEISVHSNELAFDELEERLFAIIDNVDRRFANRDKNYMNYTV
ncbi:MAG TPA: hypothetical protein ENF23_01875 [Methanosarcinales archaeon]|nr:MAG: hypothetical protein DRO03_10810 [Methanosarcinales archaeon]HDN65036.1 hypothetical protein [Methanosarcinales archaeon]